MQAIALLGGFGTRLRPLTLTVPKQMLPVAGRPMIEWVAQHLRSHGVTRLVLALGYKSEAFTEAYPGGSIAGLPFAVAVEPEPKGTAGAVRFAAEAAGVDERFIVVNADVLTDVNVGALVRFHEVMGARATISLQPVDDPSRFGVVELEDASGSGSSREASGQAATGEAQKQPSGVTAGAGRVLRFVEKPAAGTEPSNLASAGTYVIEPEVVEMIAGDRPVSIERETFPVLAASGQLFALAERCYWLDTGTPQHYLTANLDVLEGRRGGVKLSHYHLTEGEQTDRDPNVGRTAQVRASVVPPSCALEAEVVIQRSVLMDGCRLGRGAVVCDSILGPNVTVSAGAMVLDGSVVGAGETVPAGARLTGVRQPSA